MSSSSPADLAVAFRSLTRRLREAPDDDTPAGLMSEAGARVQSAIGAAAALLGVQGSADAVAAAIESRRLQDWSDADLDALQEHANAAARAIRTVEDSRR